MMVACRLFILFCKYALRGVVNTMTARPARALRPGRGGGREGEKMERRERRREGGTSPATVGKARAGCTYREI